MRLPVKSFLPLAAAIALASAGAVFAQSNSDYPVLVGNPYSIEGVTFTPVTTMNYDQVGKAAIGTSGGTAITGAHHTLPIPSYVEVTSLESGRTILVRLDRRGPMDSTRLIELSPGAATQLGLGTGEASVRVRRGNPPEQERSLLRGGLRAGERLSTPPGLLSVLRRKLEQGGLPPPAPMPKPSEMAAVVAVPVPVPTPAPQPSAAPPIAPKPKPVLPKPQAVPAATRPAPVVAPIRNGLVVQVGAFSTKARAEAAAAQVRGTVSPAGKLWRVRKGPYATGAEADTALAQARTAGYKDATIQRAE